MRVIAVDPRAERPARPRWFALDDVAPGEAPRLACWVARSDDIGASAATSAEALGRIQTMTRGALEWLISIPDDGSLPLGGVAPALIEWQAATHPAAGMTDLGCTLEALAFLHPEPQRVEAMLTSLALREPGVTLLVKAADEAGLVAHIRTPQGRRVLGPRLTFA